MASWLSDECVLAAATPCYVLNTAMAERLLLRLQAALHESCPGSVVALSVKTNPLPQLLEAACRMQCCAEVVSAHEYELAMRCGFEPRRIVYNGPLKSRATMLHAIEHGAMVNIETHREVEWLADLAPSTPHRIGLRLNVNIERVSPADGEPEHDDSRFGFSAEGGELGEVLHTLHTQGGAQVVRLHLHRWSRTRSLRFYDSLVGYALDVARNHGIHLDDIDIGGGYGEMLPGKPSLDDYAHTLVAALQRHGGEAMRLILEPGAAVVAPAMALVAEVIDVKQHDGAAYATLDASRFDVDALCRRDNYPLHIVRRRQQAGEQHILPKQVLCGCTCMEHDRLMVLRNTAQLRPGDRVVLDRVGAYSISLAPDFCRPKPPVMTIE